MYLDVWYPNYGIPKRCAVLTKDSVRRDENGWECLFADKCDFIDNVRKTPQKPTSGIRRQNKPVCRAESDGLYISSSPTACVASSVSSGVKAALQSADESCEEGRKSDESRDRVVRKMRLHLDDHVLRIEC